MKWPPEAALPSEKRRWTMAVAYQRAFSSHQGAGPAPDPDALRGAGAPAGGLAPLLEGARARGVADALEMAGQAAILLGGAGDVLHAGLSAQALLGEGLSLREGRLVPREQGAGWFGALMESALVGANHGTPEGLTLAAGGGGAMRVRILPFAGGQANPAQLLKAVVLLDRVD